MRKNDGRDGARDTVYTATSEESAPPRFRSVNSWVQQQAGRVLKGRAGSVGGEGGEEEVPEMPRVPVEVLKREGHREER